MTMEELIAWGLENKVESFITKNREKILKLVNDTKYATISQAVGSLDMQKDIDAINKIISRFEN